MKSSAYRGVSQVWYYGGKTKRPMWIAYILQDGRQMHLGTFKSEVEAAKRRDAELVARGRFAELNFPLSDYAGD